MFSQYDVIPRPTCIPVGDIYRHQIFLEVQIVISVRIKYTENMRGDLGGVTFDKLIKNPEEDIFTFGEYFPEESYQMKSGEPAVWTFIAKPEERNLIDFAGSDQLNLLNQATTWSSENFVLS